MARAARRVRSWAYSATGPAVLAASTGVALFDLLGNYEAATGKVPGNQTVVRILLNMSFWNLVATAANVDVGIVIVSGEAQAVGITAMPEPDEFNVGPDWMYWRHVLVPNMLTLVGNPVVQHIDVDLRSMRKLQAANKSLMLILQNGGAGAVQFGYGARTLLLDA